VSNPPKKSALLVPDAQGARAKCLSRPRTRAAGASGSRSLVTV